MKYNILDFDQRQVLSICKIEKIGNDKAKKISLDIADLLILQVMSDFMNRKNIIKYTINDKMYFSVQYKIIIEDLPILNIKQQALVDRLNKMVKLEVLEKEIIKNQSGSYTVFRMGDLYERMKYVGTSSELQVQEYQTTSAEVVDYIPKDYSTNNYSTNTNNKKIEDKSSIEKVPTDLDWRASFSIYKQLVFEARNQLKCDNEFKAQMAKYNPNADYELSIDKSVDLFWGTEQGWEHCKKSKSKKINMLSALKKNFDKNIVYKQWNKKGQVKTTVAENDNEQIMLPDGTFKMNGYRYYYSRLNGRTFSIPIKALPMPQDGEYEYDLKMGWYKVD